MAEMHPSMARLYAAVSRLQARDATQARLARALNTSSQRIKNWEDRGISQLGANEAQAQLGINATWILDGEGEQFISGTPRPPDKQEPSSQSARQDFVRMGYAITVLREYLEIVGDPPEWVSDPILLEVAYSIVVEFSAPVDASNVIDLTKRLGRQIRSGGGAGDGRGEVEGTGSDTGKAHRRTTGN